MHYIIATKQNNDVITHVRVIKEKSTNALYEDLPVQSVINYMRWNIEQYQTWNMRDGTGARVYPYYDGRHWHISTVADELVRNNLDNLPRFY